MTRQILSKILMQRARALSDQAERKDPAHGEIYAECKDDAELLRVLARFVEGKSLYDAFGAPGHWGYDTQIGDALAQLYKTDASVTKGGQQA